MTERWRKVRRATGYKVSSEGRIRSLDRTLADGRAAGGVMLQPFGVDGYLHVTINGEQVPVHHVVLEAFHGLRPYGTEGCHGPGGRQDNRSMNLRWDTHRENEKDKKRESREGREVSGTRQNRIRTPGTGGLG